MQGRIARPEIADADRAAQAEHTSRRARDQRQGAALRVATEECTLRALEHLDALDVEQGGVKALRLPERNAVNIDADAVVAGSLVLIVRHDAADADGQRRLAGLERGDPQAGDSAVGEVEEAEDVAIL